MKKILLVTVLLLCFLVGGCASIIDSTVQDLAKQMTDPADVVEPFIGFSKTEVENVDKLRQLKPEELQNYTSRYSDYNTYTYYKHLNESEKLLYHAYEYALDEALPYFWVDDRLLQDMEWTAFEVLEFLALDSAMVGQNLAHSQGGYTVTHAVLDVQTAKESYTALAVKNFTEQKRRRKEEAILEARQIVDRISPNWTDREKAEYFYDYLGKNVVYETDIPGEEYLYTALCEDRTNCDGYTNAFALLCRLSDIPCIEINSDTPANEEGHTWNAVFLENKWVHVDVTGAVEDVTSECKNRRQERVYFGFPDALLEEQTQHADLIPACSEGLSPILNIPTGNIADFNSKVKTAFKENRRKFVTILVDEGDLEDQIEDDLATRLDCNLYYTYYETAEGKMVYYLFNDEP